MGGLNSCNYRKQEAGDYVLKLVEVDSSWGYEIWYNGKVFIHQPYIPAVEGNIPFPSKQMAETIGNIIIEKLEHNKLPVVKKDELRKIPGCPPVN